MRLMMILLMVFGMHFSSLAENKPSKVVINVTAGENGYEPSEINVNPGSSVVLNITRPTDNTCATEIELKERKITHKLPLNKPVSVEIGIVEKGEIRFACGMNMIKGHIIAK